MLSGRFSSTVGHVGVAWDTHGIKLIQIREQGGGLEVIGAGRVDAPRGIDQLETGYIVDQLRSALTTGGFAGRRCAVALCREDIQIQSIRLPGMPEEELRQAALWEASQRFGFDRETMETDFIRTGAQVQGAESREEVLIVAASHEALTNRLTPLIDAGMRPVAVDVHFAAIARAVSRHCRREADRDTVRAVLDIGHADTIVMILRGDQIAFAKPVGIGGRHFNEAVAEHLDIDATAAGELRLARMADGHEDDPQTDRAVFDAVRPLIGDLIKEVTLCLRYYGVTFRGHPPDTILLTGTHAREPELDRLLAESCKLQVCFDDSAGTLKSVADQLSPMIRQDHSPMTCWAAPTGLSLRHLDQRRRRSLASRLTGQSSHESKGAPA